MWDKIKFHIVFYCLKDLYLSEFRDDILSLYNDNAFYDFELGVTYYLHGFDDSGRVFTRISFKLASLDDK